MKRIGSAAAIVVLFVGFWLVRDSRLARAQAGDQGKICIWTRTEDPSLKSNLVMMYLMRNGKVIKSGEVQDDNGITDPLIWGNLAVGIYDVKEEGEGVGTIVKRGVIVSSGSNTDLKFLMKAGKGVHVVDYPTGAASADDVATRLAKLEAAVKELQRK